MQSPLVRYQLAIGERIWWLISGFFVDFEGWERRGEGDVGEDGGISGCRCVSFGLAVTSCFHTITNTAHSPSTTTKTRKEKKKNGGKRQQEDILFIFVFNVPYICETSTSQSICCVFKFVVFEYITSPSLPQPPLCLPFSASHPYPRCIL